MRCRIGAIVLIGMSFVLMGTSKAQFKSTTSVPRSSALASQDDILSPEMAASRKAALETQLEALERSSSSKEELDKARVPFDEMLTLFKALEDVRKRRDTFHQQLDTLPKRLKELAANQKALEARQPGQFATATEALRDQYDAERHAVQAEIQSLLRQNSAAEARLAAIPHELEQRLTERLNFQQRLSEARRQFLQLERPTTPVSEISRLEVQLQLSITEVQALETERQWLIQRGPLHDMLLRVAQTKLAYLEQELSAISDALRKTFEQEQAILNEKILEIQQQLNTAGEPLEALRLEVDLETARLQQVTADYRQKLSWLNNNIMSQEQRTVQERQDADRIASLFEKYANGESGGELLLLAFERLRLERQRFRDVSVKGLEADFRVLTQLLYQAEDQLYHYDRQAQMRWSDLLPPGQAPPPALRQAFDEKKGALRDQQQVLATMAQAYTTLLSLHREYKRLFDDSYYLALTKIFWLRDAERFSLTDVRHIMTGAGSALSRLQEMVRAEAAWLRSMLAGALHLWVLAFLLLLVMPWIAYKTHTYLREMVASLLTRCAERGVPCGMMHALLIVMRAAVWPAYLLLLAWSRTQFTPPEGIAADGLVSSSLQGSAIILFGALLSRDMLRAGGWGRQFWEWPPELCRFLYRIILVACFAALVLLVPRHVLLTAPGEADVATASLALARFLLLVFQGTILVLVAVVGWRQNPLMADRLSRSHQAEGLLWRLWPFIYLLILAGLAGIITLDILGYRYASRFVWLRSLKSFSVLLLWRLLMALLLVRLLHHLVDAIVRLWFRGHRGTTPSTTPFDQVFRIAYMAGNTLLAIVAGGIILEIWGVSVSWFLTSPLGSEILRRAVVVALTIALMILVMKISRVVTEYLVQPRTTPQGIINQPNRKFRTMVPLIHTLLKFGIVFGAMIVVLQQLNVAIGPILTGVGIFGLAVGFASQSLIKDVINGLFILFEDSLSVGDIVTLRGVSGEVEKVTLRAVTIRDLNGNVHVIPNSTLDLITNMTKVFSRQVIDVGVAYREDVDSVVELLNELSEELQNDPTYGWDMMRPLEIMGVDDFADSAVIIRTRLWTLPGKQWRLSREFRRRLKKVFDERGVEIPFPHRTIYWGMPKENPQSPIHIALDPPPPSQRADNGISRSSELKPPIMED